MQHIRLRRGRAPQRRGCGGVRPASQRAAPLVAWLSPAQRSKPSPRQPGMRRPGPRLRRRRSPSFSAGGVVVFEDFPAQSQRRRVVPRGGGDEDEEVGCQTQARERAQMRSASPSHCDLELACCSGSISSSLSGLEQEHLLMLVQRQTCRDDVFLFARFI